MNEDGIYNSLISGLIGNLVKDDMLEMSVKLNIVSILSGLDSFDNAKSRILDSLQVTEDKKSELFYDQIFGIGSSTGLTKWYQVIKSESSGSAFISELKNLSEYFSLSMSQISTLKRFIASSLVQAEGVLQNLINCPKNKCSSLFMFKQQTSDSKISKNLLSQNTIADGKNLFFPIEYSAFYEDNYMKISDDYANLYLSDEQTNSLYNIDEDNLAPNKVWDSITHFSNLQSFRDSCKRFWDDNIGVDPSLSYLQKVMKVRDIPFADKKFRMLAQTCSRFKLNKQQAEVFCGYFEQIVSDMMLLKEGGNFQDFVLAQFTSEKLEKLLNNLKTVTDNMVQESFVNYVNQTNPDITCTTILEQEISLEAGEIEAICNGYTDKPITDFLNDLYDNCEHNSPVSPFNMKKEVKIHFCTSNPSKKLSYMNFMANLYTELKKIYSFSDSESFSLTKLAIKQIFLSTLTNSVNKYIDASKYPQSLSIHEWSPELFYQPFEVAFFVNKYKMEENIFASLSLNQLTQILNKGSLLNPLTLYYTLIKAQNGDFSLMKETLGLGEEFYVPLKNYLVLFIRDFYLGGFYINLSEQEIEHGFHNEFIKDMSVKPILMGGDPSLMYPVTIKLQESLYKFEKFTGETNYDMVDNFFKMNDSQSITNDMPIFNGNTTSVYRTNPWKQDIPVNGCDNFCPENEGYSLYKSFNSNKNSIDSIDELLNDQFEFSSNTHEVNVYGPPLNRTIKYNYLDERELTFMNLKLKKYVLDQDQYSNKHPDFNQEKYNGFLNMTTVFNYPIVVSQNHQFNVEQDIASKFAYLDKTGNPITPSKEMDGGFYEVEERTHGVTQMNLHLHFNLEINQKTALFIGYEDEIKHLKVNDDDSIIVPIYNLQYWTSMNEQTFKSVFGTVGKANEFLDRYYALFVTIFLVLLVLFCILGFFWFRHEQKNKRNNDYVNRSTEEHLIESQDNN